MDVRARGVLEGGHHVLFGEWDPTDADHERLFAAERVRAETVGRRLLVVTFDPSPVSLLMGSRVRPPMDDLEARLETQRRHGVHSRLVVVLDRHEVDRAGVRELLEALATHVEVAQLVLGSRQTLGTQLHGNDAAIRGAAAEWGMSVRRLPARDHRGPLAEARSALARGRVARAVELLGRPLTWTRPGDGVLRLPWPPGRYRAVALHESGRAPEEAPCGSYEVVLTADGEDLCAASWPARAPTWLGFVEGPADDPSAGAEPA